MAFGWLGASPWLEDAIEPAEKMRVRVSEHVLTKNSNCPKRVKDLPNVLGPIVLNRSHRQQGLVQGEDVVGVNVVAKSVGLSHESKTKFHKKLISKSQGHLSQGHPSEGHKYILLYINELSQRSLTCANIEADIA